MAMEYSIQYLEQTGDPEDQITAEILRKRLEARGTDIPLPTAAIHELDTTQSKEDDDILY